MIRGDMDAAVEADRPGYADPHACRTLDLELLEQLAGHLQAACQDTLRTHAHIAVLGQLAEHRTAGHRSPRHRSTWRRCRYPRTATRGRDQPRSTFGRHATRQDPHRSPTPGPRVDPPRPRWLYGRRRAGHPAQRAAAAPRRAAAGGCVPGSASRRGPPVSSPQRDGATPRVGWSCATSTVGAYKVYSLPASDAQHAVSSGGCNKQCG